MLQIQQKQFDELAQHAHQIVVSQISATLKAELPDEWRRCGTAETPGTIAPDKALHQVLGRGIELGFVQPMLEAGFAALYFINLRFSRPGHESFLGWARALLERQDADPEERLALVEQTLAWRGERSAEAAWAHQRLQSVMKAFQ